MTAVMSSPSAIRSVPEMFYDLVHARKSVRAFLPQTIPQAQIKAVFDLAKWAPSNCNSQPWNVVVAGGATLVALRGALLTEMGSGTHSPDLPYNVAQYTEQMRQRQVDHVLAQRLSLGIARDDINARRGLLEANLSFFGAPHVALLFMPSAGNEREAGDIGMYAQTLLLAFEANGLAAVPQTSLGMFAAPIRRVLGTGPELKLLFGISFGYEDVSVSERRLVQSRAELAEHVRFLD